MRLMDALRSHLNPILASHQEAIGAFDEFVKNIPRRILGCEVETARPAKHGVAVGDKVYKYGYLPAQKTVFIEFYECRNQSAPTMAMFVDAAKAMLTVKGAQTGRHFHLCFRTIGGNVEKVAEFK